MKENFLIVGSGAMGKLFAARLDGAGCDVTMLGTWKEGLENIRSDGVRFIDASGSEHRLAVHATDDPRECIGTRYALVLVKAWQTERAARQLVETAAAYTSNSNGLNPRGLRVVAEYAGLALPSVGTLEFGPDQINGSDCFHPNIAGQREIADLMWQNSPVR